MAAKKVTRDEAFTFLFENTGTYLVWVGYRGMILKDISDANSVRIPCKSRADLLPVEYSSRFEYEDMEVAEPAGNVSFEEAFRVDFGSWTGDFIVWVTEQGCAVKDKTGIGSTRGQVQKEKLVLPEWNQEYAGETVWD